ncbi:MAG: manganese-dependent inorganic pyrophosphatase [Nanoarchaeota archaeon]|nr:manganese-dependent inorganic pyrophosphatase [Nanoarchaeota archaeon]
MKKVFIVGHRNPDTDSICSAIGYAHLLQKSGGNAVPARLGPVNDETRFVLKKFGGKTPALLKSGAGKDLILVDHNELSQTLKDIEDANVIEVIDHHRVGNNVETVLPINFEIKVLGSTCTIITDRFFEERIPITKKIAGLLLSGILSDTLLLKSPTTTKKDVKAVKILSTLAKLNYRVFGSEMLKAGTGLVRKTPAKILETDLKEYVQNGFKIAISQVPVIDEKDVDKIKNKVFLALRKSCEKKGYAFHLVMFTDIDDGNTELMGCGPKIKLVEKAFGKKFDKGLIFLKGVVSRKMQVQPAVLRVLKK